MKTNHSRVPAQPDGPSGQVIDLRTRAAFRPDIGALARQQVASARRRLGLTPAEFADVLAPMLGGWVPTADKIELWEQSIVPPGDVVLAAGFAAQAAPREVGDEAEFDVVTELVGRRFADVEAVYATRSEFTSRVPPHALFDGAAEVRAAGLSLNLLCQQYADDSLRRIIAAGGTVRCLFLDPAGEAIKAREREEGYRPGHLSALTEMNIQILMQRVRQRLPEDVRPRLAIAIYDETIRFNMVIVDTSVAVVQPYLHTARGVEAPTFVLHRRDSLTGLFSTFEQTFAWIVERSTPL